MKTLKKVLVMLLAAAMVFSLVACGGSGSGENADPAAETVKIGVLKSPNGVSA